MASNMLRTCATRAIVSIFKLETIIRYLLEVNIDLNNNMANI